MVTLPERPGCSTVFVKSWYREKVGYYYTDDNSVGLSFNTLAPRKFVWNFRHVIFKQILVVDSWGISCEIALIRMSLDLTDDRSTLVQVMAWCRQATSHYLNQCWPRSLPPNGVTRPQWVRLSTCHMPYTPSYTTHQTVATLLCIMIATNAWCSVGNEITSQYQTFISLGIQV